MLARRALLLLTLCLPGIGVSQSNIDPSKFEVTGKVHKPGKYELREGMRIVDGLKIAGDFLDDAQVGRVTIVRGRERLNFDYAQFAVGKRTDQNILLENGDVLVVP